MFFKIKFVFFYSDKSQKYFLQSFYYYPHIIKKVRKKKKNIFIKKSNIISNLKNIKEKSTRYASLSLKKCYFKSISYRNQPRFLFTVFHFAHCIMKREVFISNPCELNEVTKVCTLFEYTVKVEK